MRYSRLRTPIVSGFTLLELMVVAAIVALLGAIAYPAFLKSIYKGRRADGAAALTKAQQAQELFRGSNPAYASSFGAGGLPVSSASPDGHYTLSISGVTPSTYTIIAQAKGVQANDAECKFLSVSLSAQNVVAYGSSSDGSTFSTSGPCWSK